ncbi:potassium channel family protein [Brevibacterium litoralis]|uniref:potassium channel family protein n=1 Tax=Brevibacterium litoralis TaxID=3138935 RepID=UPI0032EF0674
MTTHDHTPAPAGAPAGADTAAARREEAAARIRVRELRELSRVARWERRVEIPLLLMAVAFVAAYAITVLKPDLDPTLETWVRVVTWTTWGAFAVDFLVRVCLAERRFRYILRHWYDVLIIALPFFRPLRIIRVIGTLKVLNRVFVGRFIGMQAAYVGVTAVTCIFFGALSVLDMEAEHPEALITTYPDALWWAVVTTTTVGYGDLYPITTGGKIVAVVLMMVGIALIGSVTAGLAGWFADHLRKEREEKELLTALLAGEDPVELARTGTSTGSAAEVPSTVGADVPECTCGCHRNE